MLVLLVALALILSGCRREVGPPLIDLVDVAPREVERGDRLELAGASFPQGKKARVTFRGALHRPGEKPVSAEIVAEGTAETSGQIELEVSQPLVELFCGAAERSMHTTFTGEVEVAFPSVTPGAPPVVATLHGASLDVRPPTPRRAVLEERTRQGARALAFLGIHPSPSVPPSGGLLVDGVDPGSRAERAGIQAGDLLVEVDRVRIDAMGDLVPSGEATARLTVRRGPAATETTYDVDVVGLRVIPPDDLYGAALLLVAAAGMILFFFAPTTGAGTWLERRLARTFAVGRDSRSRGAAWSKLLESQALLAAPRGRLLVRLAPYLVFAVVSAILIGMPFGQLVVAADLDIGIVYVVLVSALTAIGLGAGGAERGKYTVLGGIRAAAQLVSQELPGAVAVASLVMMTGSLRVEEIVLAQGGWPWDWYAFRSPITLVLFVLYVGTALAHAPAARDPLEENDDRSPRATPLGARALLVAFAERVNVIMTGAITAALFLGGWQVPGPSAGAQQAHIGWQALGAALFVLKAWAVMATIVWGRWAMPRLLERQKLALAWAWLVPAAFTSFLLSAAWVAWSPGRTAQLAMGVGMFVLCGVAMARVAARAVFHVRTGAESGADLQADARLNPFV